MGRLSDKERKRLPRRDFAVPERRAYPIEDKSHARDALSRVSRFGSPSEKREVRMAVHRKYPEIKCASCGDSATHMHGKHGCCGRMSCHGMMGLAHGLVGEKGIPKGGMEVGGWGLS